jgi:hypothetical protein
MGGAPTSASTGSDTASTYGSMIRDFLASLKPTSQETAATTYLNNLLSKQEQDTNTALNSGETLPYAQGSAATINKNEQANIDAASRSLGVLTGQRTATSNALGTALQFAKPVSVAAGTTLVDPTTNQPIGGGSVNSNAFNSLADKNAADAFNSLITQNPTVDITWDPNKSPTDNLAAARDAVTQSGAQALAEQLVNGTLAPSELSKRATGASAYSAVLSAAKALDPSFDIAKADRNYRYANQTSTQNTLNYLGSLVGGVGQTGNLDELQALSNTIPRTQFPALNDAQNWLKLQTGNPSIAAYYATATEVADQVAKILQGGGTGSGTSDAKLAQAQSLFQSGFTPDQMNAVISALKPLLANRAQNIIGDNPYLSDYADQFGFTQNVRSSAPASSASSSSGGSVGWF